ncbi:MAG: hypothetical protein AAF403_05875 [Pseudomonadota bacterium]
MQYHRSESLSNAKYKATQALVIRELLVQRASELGLCNHDEAIKNPDDVFEQLFAQEIKTPKADKKTCRHFYKLNKNRFYTSPLFEVSHILYPAAPSDETARKKAFKKAEKTLAHLQKNQRFLARLLNVSQLVHLQKPEGI